MPLVNPYLADVFAAFQPGADLAGYGTPSATPVQSGTPLPAIAPAPNATGFPSLAEIAAQPPSPAPAAPLPPAGPPPPPPAPGMSLPTDNPAALASQPPPLMSQGPAPSVQVGAEPGPPPPGPPMPGQDPHAFDLARVSGGGAPAHEVDLRGPTLTAEQGKRNDMHEAAYGAVNERNQALAEEEYQQAVTQERQARLREQAYQQSVAEQEDEFATRQADFDTTARQMSRMGHVDPGRLWASKSVGQKIAGGAEMLLAGFLHAPSYVRQQIADDVKSQEFAYYAARDQANAKQTAFSSAMAKYQNVNAARAMANAAGTGVLQAQLAQIAARNKGNDTGNRAILAMADLENDRLAQIQQGIRFVPAQAGGRYFMDPQTGLIYNETEAKALRAKQVEYGQQERMKVADVGGQLTVQRDKAAIENGAEGGLGKENAQKLALEQAKGQMERDALLAAIGHGQDNVKAIVKGGYVDNALAHEPAWVPGVTSSRANVATRDSYNNTARLAVAAAYKLSTDATEPKNRALLEEYAGPYIIDAGDNEKSAAQKMQLLRGLVERGAASKGVAPPNQKPAAMPWAKLPGDKK